jgi:ABC-type Mn2+/Zn2+ transport system ATPase subunit/ABC-type nitrate/sulfonate/bicarbonate transport system permease component
MSHDLVVRGLHAGYESPLRFLGTGKQEVISGVDLVVHSGQVTALLAPNAAGKSTFMLALVAEWRRWSGVVLLGGEELRIDDVAWLPQNPALSLAPWRPVWREAAQPLLLRGWPAHKAKAKVEALMNELSFDLPLDRRVDRLSGGQKVRVAVMRALCLPEAPKLFVADEPMEGLDAASRATLVRVISGVASKGVAVLLTSHRLEDLYDLRARGLELVGNPVTSVRDIGLLVPAGKQALPVTSLAQGDSSRLGTEGVEPVTSVINEIGSERGRRGDANLLASLTWGLIGLFVGLVVWKVGALLVNNSALLPPPESVFWQAVGIFNDPERRWHVLVTTARALGALLVAALLAIPLGVVLGYDKRTYAIAAPWIAAVRAMPVFLLVSIAAGMWPGRPEFQRLTLVILTVFVIGLQIMSATAAVAPRRRIELTRILGGRLRHRLAVLFHEVIGAAFAFLEVGLPLSILVTILVETLLIPQSGLGMLAVNHMTDRDVSLLFALVMLPGLVGALGTWVLRRFGRFFQYES